MSEPFPLLTGLSEALQGLRPSDAAANLSGATLLHVAPRTFLVVVSDEGYRLAFVPVTPDGRQLTGEPTRLRSLRPLLRTLADGPGPLRRDDEIDVEGITATPHGLVVVGSASLKRKRVRSRDVERGRARVLERLARVAPASGRGRTHSDYALELVVQLDDAGEPTMWVRHARDLRALLLDLPLLQPFRDVPSKDNGLDVEAVAWHEGHVWLGLRGPVLRGWALLVRLDATLGDPRLYPVELGGMGIRALESARSRTHGAGLCLVSGPTLPHGGPFDLWHWSPPAADDLGVARRLLRLSEGAKADTGHVESLFAIGDHLAVMVDGVGGGAPRLVLR